MIRVQISVNHIQFGLRNRGNFAIGKQPEISLTSYGKWNDYEQDSFNFSIQYLNFQCYGTGENSTDSRAHPIRRVRP